MIPIVHVHHLRQSVRTANAAQFSQETLSECASSLALLAKSLKTGRFSKAAASCRTPKSPLVRKNNAALAEDGGAPMKTIPGE